MAMVYVLFISLFLCLTPAPLLGEQCKPDPLTPCKAECNGTFFDLSLAFDFPINITGYVSQFMWSPCTSYNCTSPSSFSTDPAPPGITDSAVCQTTTQGFKITCGKASNPVWIWQTGKGAGGFPNWHIEYTFGESWRISMFYFILDDTVLEPVVKFTGEVPTLQYNFHVIGKCLGQDTPKCRKVYEKRKRLRSIL